MSRIEHATVIGSGPSAVHAAVTLLEQGTQVDMIDIGVTEPAVPHPDAGFTAVKRLLQDPFSYFLGEDFSGVLFPPSRDLYSLPPARKYLAPPGNPYTAWAPSSFRAMVSHAQGGFGIGWGANCLEFDDDDLAGFPISRADLEDGYRTVGERIGISGVADDDLAPFLPRAAELDPPLPLNEHEATLLHRYSCLRPRITKQGCVIGRSRLAVITMARHGRRPCGLCDRCIWGCGQKAIYDPRQTLEQCRRFPTFRYFDEYVVSHLQATNARVTAVEAIHIETRAKRIFPVTICFLGAGALNSSVIVLRTLAHDRNVAPPANSTWRTMSVLDTQVVRIPYLIPTMIGRPTPVSDFQFNRLNVGLLGQYNGGTRYIHGEIISLGSLLYHPLINSLPFGARISTRVFRRLKAALGAVTLFLPDAPYGRNGIALEPDPNSVTGDRAAVLYQTPPDRHGLADEVIRRIRRVLLALGCIAPPSTVSRYPPGSGLHYAGTLPMTTVPTPVGVDATCRSHVYQNLYVVDGATFPRAPSKSITFSLMANAVRVARLAGRA